MKSCVPIILLAAAMGAGIGAVTVAQHDHGGPPHVRRTTFDIPESIKLEHEELHHALSAATELPGRTGAAAQRVAALLHAHFVSEEEFALPPLGLLRPLAGGRASPDMRDVIPLTDRLRTELPRMLEEHKAIVQALEELASAGKAENHPEVVEFADRLALHAQNEEQVLYPAALLVGEYLKLKFPK